MFFAIGELQTLLSSLVDRHNHLIQIRNSIENEIFMVKNSELSEEEILEKCAIGDENLSQVSIEIAKIERIHKNLSTELEEYLKL